MLIGHRDASECMRRVGHLVKRNIEENADEPRDSDEAVVDSTSSEEEHKVMDNLVDEERDTAARENNKHAAHLGQPLNIPSEGQAKAMMGHSSMFRGVCWYKRDQKWQAQIRIDEKQAHLGNFDDEETAARKYDEHAARLGRPLNFPSEGQAQVTRTSSKFLGVTWSIRAQNWLAEVLINDHQSHVCICDRRPRASRRSFEACPGTNEIRSGKPTLPSMERPHI